MNAAQQLSSSPLQLLAERATGHGFWTDVAERCARFETWMAGPERPARALTDADLQRLVRALQARLPCGSLTDPDQASSEIASLSASLSDAERWRLYQQLLRGLDPASAFDTYQEQTLFSEAELAAITSLRQRGAGTRIRLPMLRWKPGHDIEYSGYVCAIVKVTRQCNLRCGYCHDWRTGPEARMKFEVMLQVVSRLLACPTHAVVDFVWHGGEPTLLGKREFSRILALQALFKAPGQKITNVLQTNATAITEDWARFLADFGFRASVSLDGPRELHDRARPMASGRSSYDATRKGLALLKKHGLAKAVLIVVGDDIVEYGARRLVEFLQTEGLTKVALLPVRPDNPPTLGSAPYLDQHTYAKFLIDVHRERLARPEPWIAVRELDVLLATRSGQMPTLCEHLGNCVGYYYSIDPNGDVSHCDKYVGDPAYQLGNVLENDFDEIRASQKLQGLRQQADASRERMKSCRHYDKCRGWCPHERYVAKRTRLGIDPKCCGLGPIFDALDGMAGEGT
jgi:uncharacterized protein